MKLTAKKLSEEEINTIVSTKLNWILDCCSPEIIYLFGSASSLSMTDASDVDLIIIFNNLIELKQAEKNIAINRPKDDWPHDLIFHTIEGFNKSVSKGGGASWVAKEEGKIIYQKEAK